MEPIRGEVSLTQACAWIGISRATYYRWKDAYGSQYEDHTVEKIHELCKLHKFRYGYRKITALLRMERKINHKRVQRIMQREGLQCRVKVKKRKPTGQPAYIAEHLLKRQFEADAPMQKLVTDITICRLAERRYTCRASWTCLTERLWHTVSFLSISWRAARRESGQPFNPFHISLNHTMKIEKAPRNGAF
ncbi:IS3 family transposase [Paenibacillus lautus]|uniref:IS3 family transposase n=1 Tax=Paenibacillus lautus TaxID=1401 RepID=UPI003D2BC871